MMFKNNMNIFKNKNLSNLRFSITKIKPRNIKLTKRVVSPPSMNCKEIPKINKITGYEFLKSLKIYKITTIHKYFIDEKYPVTIKGFD